MSYTETTTTGYGTRLGNSLKAIIGGFLLLLVATGLLWWNEGRAVKTDKMLNEAEKVCVEMPSPEQQDVSLDGKLVHATALATTTDSISDSQFQTGAVAIAIKHRVEYYQWVEHQESTTKDKLGGGEETVTTYTYESQWVSSPTSSANYKDAAYQDKNFVLTEIQSGETWAQNVTFGAYRLNEALIKEINEERPYEIAISYDELKALDDAARDVLAVRTSTGAPVSPSAKAAGDVVSKVLLGTSTNRVNLEYVHQKGNVLYIGRSSAAPQVGDVRVTFTKVVPSKVSILSKVTGDTFEPYKARNGQTFQALTSGEKSAAEMFAAEHQMNNMLLWALRLLGIALMIGALRAIFGFLETLLKVVPFVANILGWGVSLVCAVLGISWSVVVIAVAWFFYRPVLSVVLIAIAAVLVWFFAFKGKDKWLKKTT